MAHLPSIRLGAPGIYQYPTVPLRALTGVRMDVCAFLGVAPRGPARVPIFDEKWRDDRPCVEPARPRSRTHPVAVESFDEYRRLYGGFEGPGLLPYAVAAFFEQGGRRAYIGRVVHDYDAAAENEKGVASGLIPGAHTTVGPLRLRAQSEGEWGNKLRAALEFTARPLYFESAGMSHLTLPSDTELQADSLLRLTLPGGTRILRFAASVVRQARVDAPGSVLQATFDQSTVAVPEFAEIVEGTLLIDDGVSNFERHERLGLSSLHPRWMATVLCYESTLLYPDAAWIDASILPDDASLASVTPPLGLPGADSETLIAQFSEGKDRYAEIIPEDFFDSSWTLGDEGGPAGGVHALTSISELSLLVVPDLYSPSPLVPVEKILDPASLAGPDFETCVEARPGRGQQGQFVEELEGLRLDPRLPGELAQIAELQTRLVEFADLMQSFVVLLDVPPGLSQRQMMAWRAPFNSSYAAAYLPWLTVSRRDDSRDALVRVPPSAIAAGVIARQELAFGVPHGPANVLVAEVLDTSDAISPARHDELHPLGLNVYLRERDGVRLTAARTLSRDPSYRQLSVRRLMVMLRRVLEQQTRWIVFEPNNEALRAKVRQQLGAYLRQLYLAGAFRGATEEDAFFVRCDETLNPPQVVDAGQLITEIGVAPTEPLEFIVLQLSRDGDGTLSMKEKGE
jgi:hypothetical protein